MLARCRRHPPAADRADQTDGGLKSPGAQDDSIAAGTQRGSLRCHHVKIVRRALDVAVQRQLLGNRRLPHRLVLRDRLVGEMRRKGEIVFDLLERLEHDPAIIVGGKIARGAGDGELRVAAAPVEQREDRVGADRPQGIAGGEQRATGVLETARAA